MAQDAGMFAKKPGGRRNPPSRTHEAEPFREEPAIADQPEQESGAAQQKLYRIERGRFGMRRTYVCSSGLVFTEYRSYGKWLGLPLIHTTRGVCPTTGRRITARGVIAVGRRAVGIVAVGQLAVGVVAVGQLAIGVIAVGQAALSAGFALGQLAIAPFAALGQIAIGYVAAGQIAVGHYALGQVGVGKYAWSLRRRDEEAVRFFRSLLRWFPRT